MASKLKALIGSTRTAKDGYRLHIPYVIYNWRDCFGKKISLGAVKTNSKTVDETSKEPVCIIGMHRSGTSMVANVLQFCGLALGSSEKLTGPNESNPKGHFEHTGFLDLNDSLLKHFGGSWDNPPDLKPEWQQNPELDTIVHEARSLVGDFPACTTWGWKDPRTTIVLPFWQRIIPNLRYVICIRNPLEVALSLAQRDDIPIPTAVKLWRQYTCEGIQKTEGHPRILTFYDDYFRQPIREISRVAEFCRLRNDCDDREIQENIARELRHQVRTTTELLNERSIPLQDKVLYLSLCAIASDDVFAIDKNDSNNARLPDNFGNILSLISELHNQEKVVQLEIAVGEKDHQLNMLRALLREELRKKDEQITKLQAFSDAVRQTVAYRLYRIFFQTF